MYDKTTFLGGLAMGLCGKGNPTFKGSGKMLYNGVELPDIESVYTPELQKSHPYAYMYLDKDTSAYTLVVNVVQIFYTPDSLFGKCVQFNWYLRYRLNGSAWEFVEKDGPVLLSITNIDGFEWTNADIVVYADNTLYLAASDPVPVEDTFTKGYHVGAELRRKRVLPVAYLYNGVRLPDINSVWTDELKAEYPYAVIHAGLGIYGFYLVLLDMPLRQDPNNFGFESNNSNYRRYGGNRASEEWTLEISGTGYAPIAQAKWANYDVYNVDGTIHITASEPIPVYE